MKFPQQMANRQICAIAAVAMLAAPMAQAAIYYWDANGNLTTAVAATGTWGTNDFWSTDSTGATATSAQTIDNTSDIFFCAASNGTAGTVTVNATQSAHSITFDDATGAITLSGGTAINLGSATAGSGLFFTSATGSANVISTSITLNSAATAIAISNRGTALQTIGAITGDAASGTQTITVGSSNTGSITFNGVIGDGVNGGIVALTVSNTSTGVTNLTAANLFTGATTITRGTLNLGNATANGSLASTVLNLGGGTLSYTRTGNTTQSFTTTNVNAGASAATAVAGNTLNLGDLVRSVGGTLNIGNTGSITTSDANVLGIIGGWATYNNENWAVANAGPAAITALGTYTTGDNAAATYLNANIDVATATVVGTINANSLRFSGASAKTLTLTAGDNIIQSGGILVRSDVGANASIITGGNLAGSASGELIVHQHNASSSLTIGSIIKNNGGATGLTKSGAGQLFITGVNTYTGNTYINAGSLWIGNNNATAATLGASPYAGNIVIAGGASLVFDTTASQTLSGIISGDGTLRKSGGGTLTLSGNNTYTGKTTISANGAGGPTLSISSFNSVVGGAASSSLGAPTTVANGTIDLGSGTNTRSCTLIYTGAGETTDRVMGISFNGSSTQTIQADTTGGGLLKFTSAFTNNGSSSGSLTLSGSGNAEITQAIPTMGGSGGIVKSGNGTWTLSGANAYTNTTTISAGILIATTIGSGVASNTLIFNGGTLQLSGAITSPSTRGVTMTGAGTINTNGNAMSIAGIISSTGALTKSGAGDLTLSNANTFTGSTTVSNGTVIMTNALALQNSAYNTTGSNGTIGLNVSSGLSSGTLTLGGLVGAVDLASAFTAGYTGSVTNLTLNPQTGISNTYSGIIGDATTGMTLTKSGAGIQTLTNASNSYTGGTFISGGGLHIDSDANLGEVNGDITVSGAGTSRILLNSGSTVTLGATRTITVGSGSTIAFGDINIASAMVYTVNGKITGAGGVQGGHYQLGGLATVQLLNTTNDFTGALTLGANAAFGSFTYASMALETASLADGVGYGNVIFGTSRGSAGDTATFVWSANATGPLVLDNRRIELAAAQTGVIAGISNNNANTANTITINTNLLVSASANSKTLQLGGSNTGDNTFAGIIANAGSAVISLNKINAGQWILSNATNTYTGVTTVSGGVLRLDTAGALPGGIGTTGGTSALTFTGGVIGLGAGDFTRSLGTAGTVTAVNFTGAGGWAAYNADRLVNLGGASASITWATANTGFNAQTLILSNATATHKVTLQNPLDLTTATRTVQVDNGTATVDAELSGVITGGAAGALTKTGAGTLSLSNANTYVGVTTVSGGVLLLENATALPGGIATTGGTSNLTFNGGVIGLGVGNFTRSLNTAATVTAATFTGAGGWAAFGADRDVNLGGAGATITWTTANTGFNSQTLILGSSSATHTVSLLNPIALGSGTRTVRVDNGSAAVDGIMSGVLSGTAALTVGGGGTLSLTNSNSFNGVVTIGDNTASTLTLQVNSIGNVSGGNSALGAPTSAANGLIQIGMTSNHSTLEFINLTADQSSNRQVQIGVSAGGSGGAYILNNDADNTVTFSNAAFNAAATGTTSFNRVLRLGGSNTGNNTISGAIINNVGTSGGLVSVTKQDAGKWILSGTNTYTGATNVNAGTLTVSGAGSINTTSAINVAAGGTLRYNSSTALTKAPTLNGVDVNNRAVLGGTGTINVAVTLDNVGDVLAPGNSPGVQTFGTSQTWSSFSYDWELNDWSAAVAGTNIDQIGITGTLDLSAVTANQYILNILSLQNNNSSGLVGAGGGTTFTEGNNSWTILTATNITGFDASEWSINAAGFTDSETGTWAISQSGNDLLLSYTAIPEPSVALLGGLSLLGLALRRRRH